VSRLRTSLRLLLLSLPALPILLLFANTAPGLAARTPARAIPHLDSPEYGLSVFVFDQPATTKRDLALVKSLGFGWAKSLFRWDDLEHDYKGAFDWTESDRVVRAASAANLNLLARIDFQPWWTRAGGVVRNGPPDNPQDYADFVYAFVTRYDANSKIGPVRAIQVWNEPNTTREWGGQPIDRQAAADYVRLLDLAARAAHAADPSVIVVSAGLAQTGQSDPACCAPDDEYLQWLYDAGFAGTFDALGVNANVQCPCPSADPGSVADFNHPSFYFRRVEQLHNVMLANGDANRQVWLTEFGWTSDQRDPSYAWYATTEERKGDLIVEAFRYARDHWSPWIGLMSLWTLADPAWSLDDANIWDDEQYFWAITDPDGTRRPSYQRLLRARQHRELP
jgi:polysaccharide biosynthesis protein PslG